LILFADQPAIFADENSFKKIIKIYQPLIAKKIIKQAVIISASGEKILFGKWPRPKDIS